MERLGDGSCRIHELLPRASVLARRGVARRREQVIAANVDQVAAVAAVADPEPDLGMLDRLLVLAELNGLAARIILNKWDLWTGPAPADGASERAGSGGVAETPLPPTFAPYRAAGYEVLPTSASRGTGLDELRAWLHDRTTVLSGQSGTGKSSLVNALVPALEVRVGEVGARSGRGRHTTVAAALYPFPGGGYLADTPGLQYLALWEVDPATLTHAFPEFRSAAEACRFGNCRHRGEPACAVREAVEQGTVSERRYESYLRLLEEAEGDGR